MSNVKLEIDKWNIKIVDRSRNRMKLQIKLGAQEAEAFRNFSEQVKPDHASLDDFVKALFFAGIQSFEKNLQDQIVQHMEENRESFEASGFSFDGDGKLVGLSEDVSGSVETVE